MNKRLISRLMHQRVDSLKSSRNYYFFRGDFEYILRGVVFEYVPRGLYVWDFRFPLFDFHGPHLTYSNRLSERAGYIGKGEMSEEGIVEFVMNSIEARKAFAPDGPEGVQDFIDYLESKPVSLGNPHVKFGLASALLLDEQESRAASMLDELISSFNVPYADNWIRLRTSLQQGSAQACALLEQARQKNLRFLGITT